MAQRDIGNPKIHTGRVDNGIDFTLDVSLWSRERDKQSRDGLLMKLHGSLHWSQGGEQIYVGDPFFKGSDDRQVILYPGFKGVPDREPFATFHSYLERVLLEAERVIFIGFAFRDDHLNTIFRRSLSRGCSVVIVNPAPQLDVPLAPETYQHLPVAFDEEGVEEALMKLEAIDPNPKAF